MFLGCTDCTRTVRRTRAYNFGPDFFLKALARLAEQETSNEGTSNRLPPGVMDARHRMPTAATVFQGAT